MQHNKNNTIENSVIIQDIVVTSFIIDDEHPLGEFKNPKKFGGKSVDEFESSEALIERLYVHISNLIQLAANHHRKTNCLNDSNELNPDKINQITRLVTNEFFFFTRKPLTLSEFENLQNKIADLVVTLTENLQLILGSFAVRTSNNKVMNVVPCIECGKNPKFSFLVKNNMSDVDPVYSEVITSSVGVRKQYLLNTEKNDKLDDFIQIGSQNCHFKFNNVLECASKGNLLFYTCIDSCCDHLDGVAKRNLNNIVNDKLITSNQKPIILCSYVIVANSVDMMSENCVGETTYADPKFSSNKLMRNHIESEDALSSATKSELNFGTPATVYIMKPKRVVDLMNTAIKLNMLELAKNLVTANAKDENQRSFLHIAVMTTNVAFLEKIPTMMDSINMQDDQGNTPLHYSVIYNKLSMTKILLLNPQINPEIKNNDGDTPLMLAVKRETIDSLKLLLEFTHFDIHKIIDDKGDTLLHIAASQNKYFVASFLLLKDADPNVMNTSNGDTPLHIAINLEFKNILTTLLEFEASVDVRNYQGDTPLHLAVRKQNVEMINALLEYKPDLKIKNDAGFTALDLASGETALILEEYRYENDTTQTTNSNETYADSVKLFNIAHDKLNESINIKNNIPNNFKKKI